MEAVTTSENKSAAPHPKSCLILNLAPTPLFKEDRQRLARYTAQAPNGLSPCRGRGLGGTGTPQFSVTQAYVPMERIMGSSTP